MSTALSNPALPTEEPLSGWEDAKNSVRRIPGGWPLKAMLEGLMVAGDLVYQTARLLMPSTWRQQPAEPERVIPTAQEQAAEVREERVLSLTEQARNVRFLARYSLEHKADLVERI